jgi:hypothetical protein
MAPGTKEIHRLQYELAKAIFDLKPDIHGPFSPPSRPGGIDISAFDSFFPNDPKTGAFIPPQLNENNAGAEKLVLRVKPG